MSIIDPNRFGASGYHPKSGNLDLGSSKALHFYRCFHRPIPFRSKRTPVNFEIRWNLESCSWVGVNYPYSSSFPEKFLRGRGLS